MQRCNCTVRLAGDMKNTVLKQSVTPAEIAVLIAIHGDGSVVDIQPTRMDKTPHHTERSRIRTIYGHHVVDRIFPGEFSPLPVTVKELNLGADEDDQDPAAVAARRAADAERKRNARAAAKAAGQEDSEDGQGDQGNEEGAGE